MGKCRGRKSWNKAPLTMEALDAAERRARRLLSGRPAFIAKLEARGRRNAMFYRLAALTGLRKSELASILMRRRISSFVRRTQRPGAERSFPSRPT